MSGKKVRTALIACAVNAFVAVMVAVPSAAQSDVPPDPDLDSNCPSPGLKVESQINGDMPLGGPLSLGSLRAIDRDVVLEESMAARLASLGYEIDENAFWQLVYATDFARTKERQSFSIQSQVQGGKEPEAIGRYAFDSSPDGCPPLSSYSMTLELLDQGSRVVWRGHAVRKTTSRSPEADKERLSERLLAALRSDLKETHNVSGRN